MVQCLLNFFKPDTPYQILSLLLGPFSLFPSGYNMYINRAVLLLNRICAMAVYIRPIMKPQLAQRRRARGADARSCVQLPDVFVIPFFAFAFASIAEIPT